MVAEAKITMLGLEGSGKTCYMLGLYATMQMGLQGFTLTATDMDEDLRLTSLWERMVDEEGENRWPFPTGVESHQYEFDFSYGMRPLIKFDWLDYRGGDMKGFSTQEGVQILTKRLLESSCVFLCISGEYLKQEVSSDMELMSLAKKTGVDRMNKFLMDISKNLKECQRPFPIVIVITKFDQCYERAKDKVSKEKLFDDIKKMFNALFLPNKDWLVMLCPVTLGKGLENDGVTGEIQPKNLHLPLLFALYAKFREYAMTEQARVNETQIRLDILRSGNWFQRFFTGDDQRVAESSLENYQNHLQEIQQRMALLAQELTNAQIFLGGKEQQVDV
ncbi:hypothetical protein [Calothrix sp. PCC 6303]|uniref:hypothetical protein n=1 Tax=Calothrix sp. PCC 6303 TaxID=1170562 RepID=UPI0002A01202|nr:hypothetical protein [Calothrix sp. PCC 6303]AFZ04564.1 hypothetical protein Cal6303_5693 [Calothrix sp. PCC 6303]